MQAIDIHAHYGVYGNGRHPLINDFMTGDGAEVVRRAIASSIDLTIVSPLTALMPRGQGDSIRGNDEADEVVRQTPRLARWAVLDPRRPESYDQVARHLRLPGCVGIKIHPEEHLYPISQYGEGIFRFAAEQNAVILTHSGEQNSMPEDFVPFADQFPEATLILAHLGCGWDGNPTHQVRAIQASRHGNIYTDTSSAMSLTAGLWEWALREVGAGRLLFGTDAPLYSTAMHRARLDATAMSEADRELIACGNARRLLPLQGLLHDN